MPGKSIKTCVVTGAARRVGREFALALAAEGFDVAVHYNSSGAEAEQVAERIRSMGRKACLIKANLANHNETERVIPQAAEALGPLGLLVNSASIFEKKPFLETEPEFFDRHMDINLKAPFFLTSAFARQAEKHQIAGHVVNILDTKITKNTSTYFAYLLSKKAFADFTRMAAASLSGIRVNAIAPSTVAEFSDNAEQEYGKGAVKMVPSQNVVSALNFLLENESLNGQFIYVDAGDNLA